jgi:hypothetical protein
MQMTPNPHLGDVTIELVMTSGNKVTFVMRPTPEATMEIEEVCGYALPALAMQLAAGNVKLTRLADIIVAGAKAAGHTGESFSDANGNRIDFQMKADRLYHPVFYSNRWKVQEVVYKYLDACLNGGISSEDLKKSGAQSTASSPIVSIGGNGSASQPSSSGGPNESSGQPVGGPFSPPSNG